MSTTTKGLGWPEVSDEILRRYCATKRITFSRRGVDDADLQEFILKEQWAPGVKPSETRAPRLKFIDNLTQIAPDWDRRRKLGNVRMKTFLRIYLSKWFWKGLEWQEREFVLILLKRSQRLPGVSWLLENQEHLLRKGVFVYSDLFESSMYLEPERAADQLDEPDDLFALFYSQLDYQAIWKLRSVQSLRDFIFVRVTGHEHEGKKGIKKPRIIGYRDGKASPPDPRLIKMALEVDRVFFTNEEESRWRAVEDEIDSLIPG